MRLRAIVGGWLAGSVFVACGFADEPPPPRKPGLWELTMTAETGAPRTMRVCLDEASESALLSRGADKKDKCSSHDAHRDGATFVMDSVCQIMGSEQTAHSVTTFEGDTAYTTVIDAHFAPPFLGKTATKLTQTGKWLGACEPDMKPGEAMVNGARINTLPPP